MARRGVATWDELRAVCLPFVLCLECGAEVWVDRRFLLCRRSLALGGCEYRCPITPRERLVRVLLFPELNTSGRFGLPEGWDSSVSAVRASCVRRFGRRDLGALHPKEVMGWIGRQF
jgi:hypothetical protein